MTRRRIALSCVEASFWCWHGALVVAGGIAWTCEHQHAGAYEALTCAKRTRLLLRPSGQVVSLPPMQRARMAQRRLGR